jgi:molybdopterin-guanine dinucleotide biosynthesis protein A
MVNKENSVHHISCILFAGGKSSRMGENKALLPFAGYSSLSHYQYERLQKLFKDVYIATKEPALFDHIDAKFIDESEAGDTYAPTAGFVSLFKQLKDEDHFFVLSVDAPFVNETVIDACCSVNYHDYDAVIVKTPSGMHPMCGIYSRKLQASMQQMFAEDNHKLGKLLKNSNVYYVEIDNEDLLMNVNTPDEYQKALKMLG